MSSTALAHSERLDFVLPEELEASEPPDARGLTRDAVRLMVARLSDGSIEHVTFSTLPALLDEGDLVVVNTSGTIPAALDATGPEGEPVVVHLSTQLDEDVWVVEPRRPAPGASVRWSGEPPPLALSLPGGAAMRLVARFGSGTRLWSAELSLGERTLTYLARAGRPIRYAHAAGPWPLASYQNVYAAEPGSAEMPSAGRPFTSDVLMRLVAKGVGVAPVVLHTGVASLEADELPYPERVRVSTSTAAKVNQTRGSGGRVIAVGTTVVRALESAAGPDGRARPVQGWTDLVVRPGRPVALVDALLTGWHEPASSHLLMLEAM
ncbi:MAG: S-adenosylmethionine:tRNA ribosyltransferase-isomerase, partial [Acidimicrobiales bacterium]